MHAALSSLALGALVAVSVAGTATPASAGHRLYGSGYRDHWHGSYYYYPPYYYSPPPRVIYVPPAPPPVVYSPAPVYYDPPYYYPYYPAYPARAGFSFSFRK